ncbi:MAG: hypothetical protein A2046_11340 [Bacteroidetes bacterium GWA2_30_7]|nr:MAG: hypothetical protein A2046_11340 [Bacteroidetes bacterium GWA2_30_7]
MKTDDLKYDKSLLTAELFYSAFLSLSEKEKENFFGRLLSNISYKTTAYTSSGKSLTKNQYIKHIEKISKDVKKGNFISHEDMLKDAENE